MLTAGSCTAPCSVITLLIPILAVRPLGPMPNALQRCLVLSALELRGCAAVHCVGHRLDCKHAHVF